MSGPLAGVLAGWASFAGTHMYMSHPGNREKFVKDFGPEKFRAIYSGIALATLSTTVAIYVRKGRNVGPVIWNLNQNVASRFVGDSLKFLGLLTIPQAILSPNPLAMKPDESQSEPVSDTKALVRVTRHGTFMGFALIGLGAAITSSRLVPITFWLGFPAFWIVGSLHQDARKRSENIPKEFFDKTSVLPFQAIIEGRNTFELKEFNYQAALASTAVFLGYKALRRGRG